MDIIEVVSGVLLRDNSEVFCCQRLATDQNNPLGWEFPGGKIEEGETCFITLRRELQEELDIDVSRIEPLWSEYARFEDRTYNVHFFQVINYRGVPKNMGSHNVMGWFTFEEAGRILLPADKNVLLKMA
jgi:8-oxo-dGTP diphosphatase